jgi:hypothetical protein
MDCEYTPWSLSEAADAFSSGALRVNAEYQRGLVWSERQQKLLIDSLFRGYPLPRFYVHKRVKRALGADAVVHEIIDGQQRIHAMARYLKDEFALPDPADKRYALPRAMRDAPCPWRERTFSQLDTSLQERLRGVKLSVVIIPSETSDDEVRDLFIRLQSGTALTRQQVRDALPGGIAPFVERLAGRRTKRPQISAFSTVDQRGMKSGEEADENEDPYVSDRQTCAQLLTVYLTLRDSSQIVSPTSQRLDDTYHSYADFDREGDTARTFVKLLELCDKVFELRTASGSKVRKVRLFSLFLLLYQMYFARVPLERHTEAIAEAVWGAMDGDAEEPKGGKAVAAGSVMTHLAWLEDQVRTNLSVPLTSLDATRLFSAEDKEAIWDRAAGRCEECGKEVLVRSDAEYDHKTPWALGGQTNIMNGRLVHRDCHLRGRAALTPMTGGSIPS